MLQSPRSLLLEPSFASSTPFARAELSVLIESSDSDSEAGSPHSPAASPCLMELTMEEVAAAARCALPPSLPTCLMLEQLFPSAAGISACVPSADGLGVACADLLPRACAARCPAGCAPHCGKQCGKLVEPLPGGGLLAFALAHPPSEVERSLMEAFAAALSDQLRPRGAAAGKGSLLSLLEAPPLHSPPAVTPHDAFWAPF